jgi:hypothetical protein
VAAPLMLCERQQTKEYKMDCSASLQPFSSSTSLATFEYLHSPWVSPLFSFLNSVLIACGKQQKLHSFDHKFRHSFRQIDCYLKENRYVSPSFCVAVNLEFRLPSITNNSYCVMAVLYCPISSRGLLFLMILEPRTKFLQYLELTFRGWNPAEWMIQTSIFQV